MSIELMMPSNHLNLSHSLLLLPQTFPASGSFPVSWLFALDGQSIGASSLASVLPMNIEGRFPLGLTGLILLSKGLSRVSSSTTVRKHQFFSAQPSLWSDSHIRTWLLDHRKTIALTKQTVVGKVMSVLFNMLSKLSQFFFQVVSFNFMAAVTICSDVEAKKTKSVTVSTFSPSIPDVQS